MGVRRSWSGLVVVAAVVLSVLAVLAVPVVPARADAGDAAATAVLTRTIGARAAGQLHLAMVPGRGAESFTISGRAGAVQVRANTRSALLMGAGWYLKYVAHADVNLGTGTPRLPGRLPAPRAPITQSANASNRFALNDTNDGYTDPYVSWDQWQHRLDVLALHGINEVYVTPGVEAVYERLFTAHGYSAAQLRAWIPQPAHQPWWLLQNLSSDQAPLTQKLIDDRARLGRRITDRVRELGMTPVLPGYFGTVPADFGTRDPGANVVPQGTWVGYRRPGWLDPTTPDFAAIAADYYRISDAVLGPSTMYKMDPLHEGGNPGNVSVPAAATAIETALQTAHEGATWAILGWQSNPAPALLSGVRHKDRMFIVDGLSDRYPDWHRDADWGGVPYAFGSIYDFGGHTTLGANLGVWPGRYFTQRAKPGSAMNGIAVMPEGFDNNPAAFELLAELPWHASAFGLGDWLGDYALGRYGTSAAAPAWRTLAATAYAMPADGWSEAQDGLFAAEPSLTATNAAEWSPGYVRYDPVAFEAALPQLLAAAGSARQPEAYAYDLLDVARQVVDNRGRVLLPKLDAAYRAHDLPGFRALANQWMRLLADLDDLAGSNAAFLLGPRLAEATAAAHSPAEAATLCADLLGIDTVWGSRPGFDAGLGDYANREWQGLVGDYYAGRWQKYFASLETALRTGTAPAPIDWYAYGSAWSTAPHAFPTRPRGDTVAIARRVAGELRTGSSTLAVSVTAQGGVVTPDTPVTVTAKIRNLNALAPGTDAGTVGITVPAGLTATADTPTRPGRLAPGAEATVRWTVRLKTATPIRTAVTVTAADATATLNLVSGHRPALPWHLANTGDAAFAAAGDELAIDTSGADLWGEVRQYGAIYQPGTFADGTALTVRVASIDSAGARPWARAGLLVGADLSGPAPAGLVNLAVTPGNGCVLSWAATATGALDTHRDVSGVTAPVWLRLIRHGTSFTGQCSSDGTNWTTVGTAAPAGTTPTPDAGVFASAANSGASDRFTATFSHWAIAPSR
ncbi:alpha-N-acetylglucosaminidase [Amycolatopsis sp. PS_44_ISF1]|uniref:alpha-N-acetylglucosaminidase n=1 Tax=Amycolatopsis sp. PS_44_ISF1 TaxID=2974917 RepID=UPI0028DEB283|nr:alpha-N-acetylglucosaminidase [Amycolatopsis sp. PS_44_ISF1]MDT8912387.1 alpha-N-acetylglucosaminidase C-terminal domain-containing protein [Amycolatopsis sp. PS_44_ISF1]